MTIEASFYTFLDGLTTEIYPLVLPQDHGTPAIAYRLNNSRPQYSADGPSNYAVTMQVDCYDRTYAGVKTLQASVRALLDGYTGVMGNHYAHNVEIENEIDEHEPDTGLYRVTMLINVFYRSAS